MADVLKVLEDANKNAKKKSSKIKSLKKEKDALLMEILKLKQIYSDKCDHYKEARDKLVKKLKKRDHAI